jgi:hypothetical protein
MICQYSYPSLKVKKTACLLGVAYECLQDVLRNSKFSRVAFWTGRSNYWRARSAARLSSPHEDIVASIVMGKK